MNAFKLKAKIVERGMSITELAGIMDMSTQTLYRKLRAPLNMTLMDAIVLKDILGLTNEEAIDIFLI
jgi:plasmid maintenance system antidote protein VapI